MNENDKTVSMSSLKYGKIDSKGSRYVNVRESASSFSDVIKLAENDEAVIILFEEHGYFKVQFTDGTQGYVLKDYVIEVDDPGFDWNAKSESILISIKKLLGIEEDCTDFDVDIMLNINAAIFTLKQIGVKITKGFNVVSKNDSFAEMLGANSEIESEVKMYIYYKTKLSFDPPSSTAVLECLKEMIKEAEWRINIQVDPGDSF